MARLQVLVWKLGGWSGPKEMRNLPGGWRGGGHCWVVCSARHVRFEVLLRRVNVGIS